MPSRLRAVVAADRQVQVLDRGLQLVREHGVDRRGADLDALGRGVELAGEPEQLDERATGRRDGVARRDRGLRLDVDDQTVEVRALTGTRRLDAVGDLEDRRVDRVDRDLPGLAELRAVLRRRDVAAATLDRQLQLEARGVVQGRDDEVRVVDLDAGRSGDVRCGDLTGTLLAQVRRDRLVVLAGDDQALDVEDDLGDVFLDTGNGAELVEDAVDADAGDSRAGDRGEERAAQRVAEGEPKPGSSGSMTKRERNSEIVSSVRVGRCAMSTVGFLSAECPLYDTRRYDGADRAPTVC